MFNPPECVDAACQCKVIPVSPVVNVIRSHKVKSKTATGYETTNLCTLALAKTAYNVKQCVICRCFSMFDFVFYMKYSICWNCIYKYNCDIAKQYNLIHQSCSYPQVQTVDAGGGDGGQKQICSACQTCHSAFANELNPYSILIIIESIQHNQQTLFRVILETIVRSPIFISEVWNSVNHLQRTLRCASAKAVEGYLKLYPLCIEDRPY